VVSFRKDGWPMVRLNVDTPLAPASEVLPSAAAPHMPASGAAACVVPARPCAVSQGPLIRGQRVLVGRHGEGAGEGWAVLELLPSEPKKRRCIHPTRAAGLCRNCPRRKDGSQGLRARTLATAAQGLLPFLQRGAGLVVFERGAHR